MTRKFIATIISTMLLIGMLTSGSYTLAAESSQPTPVKITNGDFEAGMKGWTFAEKDDLTAEVVAEGNSQKCLKIVDQSATVGAVIFSTSITLPAGTAGEKYTLQFKSKSPDSTKAASIGVRLFDENDVQLHTGTKALQSLTGLDNLTLKMAQFTPAKDIVLSEGKSASDIKKMKIVIYTNGTSVGIESYIDDITLSYGGTVAADPVSLEQDTQKPTTVVQTDGFKSEFLNAINASAPVSLGAPVRDVQILGSITYVKEDGDTVFYAVTSGPPAIFFAYNVDKNTVEAKHILMLADGKTSAKVGYCVVMDSKGIINIATQGDALFFRYNPKTDELKSYGKIFEETAVMSSGFVDAEDNVYFGTYPKAKLIKYDAKTDKLVDLGVMFANNNYVRALGGYKDKIVMSGVGNPITPFAKYDIKTKVKTPIVPPSLEGKFTSDDVTAVYAMNTAGKYLFAQCKISSLSKYYLCVFDMETDKWIDYIEGTAHMGSSDLDGDLVYIHKTNNATGKVTVYSYNVKTKELKSFDNLVYNGYIVAPGIVKLKNQDKYPGKTLVGGAYTDGLILLNLEKQEINFIKNDLPAQATVIRTVKGGYNNEVILSAYMGSSVVMYDTVKEAVKYVAPSVQIEGIGVFDGNYYFGLYGKGRLTKYDPNQPPKAGENPVQLGDLAAQEQDRGFVVTQGEGSSIIWGTVPDYGRLGGAVGIYDATTKKARGYGNFIKNQSIGGLAYKNGKIYGSTHIFGGLGIDPIAETAKMFIMDYNTGKLEKQVDVKLKTDTNTQYYVGGMSFGPDGNLWVATAQTLLCVDPSSLEIKDEIKIGYQKITLTTPRYLPYRMEWDKNGILYTNIGYRISAVDIKTKEVRQIRSSGTNGLTLAENGNLYITGGKADIELFKIELSKTSAKPGDAVLKNSLSLFVNSSIAYVKGEKKSLESGNPNITAKVIDGRTLVPVRFLAENFGAKVDWDDETKTATITLDDKIAKITLNKQEISINNETVPLDVPATTIDGRTMLPLRVFCEKVMGKVVFWDDRGLIVISDNEVLKKDTDKDTIDSIVSMFK